MILPINDKYRIVGEARQWVLEQRKRRVSKRQDVAGDDYFEWRGVSYFPTLEMAVNSLHDLQLRTSGAKTIVEAMVESKRITSELVAALTPQFEIRNPG